MPRHGTNNVSLAMILRSSMTKGYRGRGPDGSAECTTLNCRVMCFGGGLLTRRYLPL